MTTEEALRQAAQTLAAAGVPDALLDAELLLRHLLGWDRARLLAGAREPLADWRHAAYTALIAERAARRPLQHLTGTQAFWKHEFAVTPDVLIPRPETELLAETALELVRDVAAPVVVDVGTGSGCIAVSIALERPDATVLALDISPAALAVARGNAQRLAAGNVTFAESDLLAAVRDRAGQVDLVVSNPPYVDPADRESLMPEVRDHDPALALFAAEGALALYARLARQAVIVLRSGGALAVEVGAGMHHDVARGFEQAGLALREVRADLPGIPRVVTGVNSPRG
jgi:release factor glutamine methyltransferase